MHLFKRKFMDQELYSMELQEYYRKYIISNEGMNYIAKIVKSLKESGLLMKDIGKTIKNEAKQ